MKKYIRWLGWHSFVDFATFKFEMSRGTECCAEAITGNYSHLADYERGVWVGLLCNPKAVVREFHADAYSKLNGYKLVRGKWGVWSGNKTTGSDDEHTEAWVKPGNFIGIVLYDKHFAELSPSKKAIIRQVVRKYNLPVWSLFCSWNREITREVIR